MQDIKSEVQRTGKVLIAYHANCIDGFTSAWATWKGLREVRRYKSSQIELLPVSYTEESIRAIKLAAARDEIEVVYIVDFSVPQGVLATLGKHCEIVVMLDHHKTAWEMYAPDDWESGCRYSSFPFNGIVDVYLHKDKCGAEMCWNYFFHDTDLPTLISYVGDYDLWKFSLPATKAVNKYLRTVEPTIGNWEHLHLTFENARTRVKCIDAGKSIQLYHDSVVRDLVEQAVPVELGNLGKIGLAVNCPPQFSSDVGHKLALLSGTFGATYQFESATSIKFSLRSTGDYDVSELAKRYYGGGHKNAAGFHIHGTGLEPCPKTGRLLVWRRNPDVT